jgi:hypothetical protein
LGIFLSGWFKAIRSSEAIEVGAASVKAFWLSYVIANRARWSTDYNRYGCELGEALISDYEAYGLTRQEFRTAKEFLENNHFATFRTTSKGTIAKLSDSRLFCIAENSDNQQPNQQPTSSQPAANQQGNQCPTNAQPMPNHFQEGEEGREGQEGKKERPEDARGVAKNGDQTPEIHSASNGKQEVVIPPPKIVTPPLLPLSVTDRMQALKLRICPWFGRNPKASWFPVELDLLEVIAKEPPEEAELVLLDAWFADPQTYHRRDLIKLLENWPSELDKARSYEKEKSNPKSNEKNGRNGSGRAYHPRNKHIVADDTSAEERERIARERGQLIGG